MTSKRKNTHTRFSGVSARRNISVRSLERGLALLVALNRRPRSSVCDLAMDTGLPRPTIYRLLDTLCKAGFVGLDSATNHYRLTHPVRSLSDGFLDDEWITKIAAPMMAEFTRKYVWPVSLFTFEAGKMMVRETTHRLSPLSVDYGMVGKRMGMLRTASGLAYLAVCPENERKVILNLLAQSSDPDDRQAREAHTLEALLKSIRFAGYAKHERFFNPQAASVSVPIVDECKVHGCMSLVFIASAITMSEVEETLVVPLQAMATNLVRVLQSNDRQLGQTCGNHMEIIGNSVSSASNTRSARINGVTPA